MVLEKVTHFLLIAVAVLQLAVSRKPLILVSCDGFRYDYLDWYPQETKFIRGLIPKGVHVRRMPTTFNTETFPSHWTIVTGLYEESHGIISNKMYDPEFDSVFTKSNTEERWWNASLPVWVTANKQGLKVASFFWPGSYVNFQGSKLIRLDVYNESVYFEFRVVLALDWITIDKVDFVTLYMHQPDGAGHKFGPRSQEVRAALQEVDNAIALLFRIIKERKLEDKVDVILVSDHGMTEIRADKEINLGDRLDPYVSRVMETGPLLAVFAKPGKKKDLLKFLNAEVKSKKLKMRVFAKENLPARFHYSNNRRIPDVLALADKNYVVKTKHSNPISRPGDHGYDNEYSDMKVPMFAVGPSFKKNVQIDGTFRQVDIYGLVCRLLEIIPQPNNGSLSLLPRMLK